MVECPKCGLDVVELYPSFYSDKEICLTCDEQLKVFNNPIGAY